jgi:hypothetical protein
MDETTKVSSQMSGTMALKTTYISYRKGWNHKVSHMCHQPQMYKNMASYSTHEYAS